MFKKYPLLICALFLLVHSVILTSGKPVPSEDKGVFDIHFMGEKVGYEEYIWQTEGDGYVLTVRGRMTKPIPMVIDKISIRLDKSFIATQYFFEGSVSGVRQEVLSVVNEGQVESVILVAGQEQKTEIKIKRDAFLLPNAVYSPYLVLTKKFSCTLLERMELSAYIIPQFETPFSIEPSEESPCRLIMEMGESETLLDTDEEGRLISLQIPLKSLQVNRVPD
ncbi:MAG: hypothetical protein JXB23_00605 [Candidatus Aminicenantes bacterium]|nr:hypothetical protein [Candidatus Aminicenantes bacterium]